MKRKSLDYVTLFVVYFAVFFGGVVRYYSVLLSHFPLNDGGLFYTMTQDILDHDFSIPVYTSYNGNVIPFGYPPFAFYLLALIQAFSILTLLINFVFSLRFFAHSVSLRSIFLPEA
jgi:hypothetical protein